MKRTIVITSIFAPNEAIKKWAAMPEHNLVVAGDRKTPADWAHPNTTFVSLDDQFKDFGEFAKLMPENIYPRKNCGYIRAIQDGADIIVDTDDDNLPYDDWKFPELAADGAEFDSLPDDLGMVNIYELFSKQHIWPRGLELNLISKRFDLDKKLGKGQAKVGVWQALADKDPDVDAIYRLVGNKQCVFDKRPPVVLGKGTFSPYNSQNTATVKELFPLLYLPFSTTFRFTDILRGWVAQPIMWQHGYHLGFTEATVYQDRNAHDYFSDFLQEIPMYTQQARAIEIATELASANDSVADNLHKVYTALAQENIVAQEEVKGVELWLKEISK